jgi:hypothetical protein
MNLKLLFLSAALAVGTAAASLGQTVLTLVVRPGDSLIANPLNVGGNTLNEILPGAPDGCLIGKVDSATGRWMVASYSSSLGSWSPADMTLAPGEGAWAVNPSSSAFIVTLTGTSPGEVTPLGCGMGYYMLGTHKLPYTTAEDLFPGTPSGTVTIYWFNPVSGQTGQYFYDPDSGGWSSPVMIPPGEVLLVDMVGEAMPGSDPASCIPFPTGQPPSRFPLPADKTVVCGSEWSFDAPTFGPGQLCPGDGSVEVTGTVTNGVCPQRITRTWLATTSCGDRITATQTVTVLNTTPPQLTCASDKSVECGEAWDFDAPVALSACCGSDPTVTVLSTITNGTCPITITRTWEATDCCTNRATCSQIVTVRDTTPPTLSAVPDVAAQAEAGQDGAIVEYAAPAASDCSGPVNVVCVPASGSLFHVGATVVRCTAADACGNTNTTSFTVTVTAASRGDLFVEDTPYNYNGAPDQGGEPDSNMAGQDMWLSRAIWIHPDPTQPAGTYLTHDNPRFGQTNKIFVRVQNRGGAPVAGARLEVRVAFASLGLTWPAQWQWVGTYNLPAIPGQGSYVAEFPWLPAGSGHYCLLARILSADDPMAVTETSGISGNVRANNNIAWRNVNVVNLLGSIGDSVEVRVRNTRPKTEPDPKHPGKPPRKPVTVVCKTEEIFHAGGGEALLNLGPLFKRWQDNGGRGQHVEIVGDNTVRCTNTNARLEDIPMDEEEEAIINFTAILRRPLPVEGSQHVCQVELKQEVDGETVGGVNYGVIARALHTDTDHDGIPDVLDPDNDNDGVRDEDDPDPLGPSDCPPVALTIRLVDGNAVVSWSGLGYRLETAAQMEGPWRPLPLARSPFVTAADEPHQFFRLVCH